MGSSSCFAVGLSKALYKIKGQELSKQQLAKKTIEFEQKIMREVVGSQDQTIASYGGFNKIIFNKNKRKIISDINKLYGSNIWYIFAILIKVVFCKGSLKCLISS